ncbi:alpha/beta-hydrolase [Daldinia grandis]|nr:alpha/beta-hydrolase [Daldinia grandis]
MTAISISLLVLLSPSYFISFVSASPTLSNDKTGAQSLLPIVNLPYESYRAARYDSLNDIYTFKSIRYVAPPVGDLRWTKPRLQMDSNLLSTGNQPPIGEAINQFLGGVPLPVFLGVSEDCLFLDIHGMLISHIIDVPRKALKVSSKKLFAVAFVYGGAYIFSSKDSLQLGLPFYDGNGLISQSGNNMIFMAMNYRVGAFGFLVGTTMENEGGSIIHHIIGQGGKLDPLFSKAILLSPAFEYMWDRAGLVQETFEAFARMACYAGTFVVGPTLDGLHIQQLPILELRVDNFWNMESLILLHTTAESDIFINSLAAGITNKIAVSGRSKYGSQTNRAQALLRDSSFTYNVRHLTESFGDWGFSMEVFEQVKKLTVPYT